MTAVTAVVAEAAAEAGSVVVVGGDGSGANGSEIGASEGTEESAAKESVFHQRQSKRERRKGQEIDQTPKGHRKTAADGGLSQEFKNKAYSPSPKRSTEVQVVAAYEEIKSSS